MAKERREAPEEELLVLHEKWVHWVKRHLREIILAAVCVILVAVGWSAYKYQRAQQEEKAAKLYMRAIFSGPDKQKVLLAELEKRYANTTAALAARLDDFDQAYSKGDLSRAVKDIDIVRKQAKGDLKAFATLGEGYISEEQGHYQEALKDYQYAANAHVGLELLAWLDMARVSELMGNRSKALEYYREVIGLHPQGEVQNFIMVKVARLEAVKPKSKGGSIK